MTDMDRFIEAADALAGLGEAHAFYMELMDDGSDTESIARLSAALTEYRAARKAITKSTPPTTSA